MVPPSPSRGAAARPKGAASRPPSVSWPDRAPDGLRLVIVLLFVCAVTPILLFLHPVGDYFVETDFYGGYAPGVRAFWSGGLDPARYGVVGPVYEVVLALLSLTRVDLFRLAQFLSLAATALTLVLASGWARDRFGRGAGWITALLMATNPTVVRYAYLAGTDALFVCLCTATFVLLFRPGTAGARFALAGLLAGVATLTRYTGIVLVPLGLAAALLAGRRASPLPARVRTAVLFALGVVLVFGPWWAFTAWKGAPPTLRFYHNLAYDVYGRARGITWDEYQTSLQKEFPTFRSVLARDPGAVAARVFSNSYSHLAEAAKDLFLWPLLLLAALGAALWALRRVRGAGPLVLYGALIYAALIPVFYSSRYHLPLLFVAAALGAAALVAPGGLYALLARGPGRGAIAGLASALVLACALGAAGFAAQSTVRDTRYNATQVPRDLPELGTALQRDWKGPGRPRLIARKPHLSYYADADPVPFVFLDSLEALARYAHEQRADYLYASWPEALLRPGFAFLLVPEFAPPGLELVSAGPDGHSALYRIRPEFGQTMPQWYPREWEVRAAEGMTRIAPDQADWWLLAGEGRHMRKDYPGANEAYERALRLHPNWGRAYADLGNLAADQGDFTSARAAYEAALANGENSPALLRNLGIACGKTGDFARAEQMITRYVALTGDPEFVKILASLREQRAKQGP